jgi:hypothetical protein
MKETRHCIKSTCRTIAYGLSEQQASKTRGRGKAKTMCQAIQELHHLLAHYSSDLVEAKQNVQDEVRCIVTDELGSIPITIHVAHANSSNHSITVEAQWATNHATGKFTAYTQQGVAD